MHSLTFCVKGSKDVLVVNRVLDHLFHRSVGVVEDAVREEHVEALLALVRLQWLHATIRSMQMTHSGSSFTLLFIFVRLNVTVQFYVLTSAVFPTPSLSMENKLNVPDQLWYSGRGLLTSKAL